MANKNPYLKDRDILDQALEHSWGKTADAKAKEKAYNREYYQRHKEEILRKARQAGEGVRTEIDTLTSIAKGRGNDRRKINPEAHTGRSTWLYGKGTAYITEDPRVSRDYARNTMKDAKRRADDWANRYKENASKGFRGAANIDLEENRKAYKTYRDEQDAYDVMRKAAVSRSHAEDEVAREKRRRGAERRFDSKLARDAQNAYSKVRRDARNAKNAIDTAANNARAYIDNARGKNGRKSSSVDASSYELQARKDQASRNRQNKAAQRASARAAARTEQAYQLNADPKLRNGRFAKEALDNAAESQREAYEKSKMAKKSRNRAVNSAAAANAASNAANRPGYDTRYDTKLVRDFQNAKAKVRDINSDPGKYVNRAKSSAEKAAENAREEAKKRMKKWFKR